MAVAFVPAEVLLQTKPRWQFVRPIRVRELAHGQRLLLHPPTGSWAIVDGEHVRLIELLIEATRRGLLDDAEIPDDHPLLDTLFRAGLLLKNGQAAWSQASFNHTANPLNTLILKMVGYCNLACTYCYDYNSVTYKERMAVETAQQAILQALGRAGPRLRILFHGGEPLLAFEEIRTLVPVARTAAAKLQKEVTFGVQTNGTRFTPAVVDFLLDEEFGIGISIDGPAPLNDLLRIDHAGRGHHAEIESALRAHPALRARAGAMTTVTRYNVRRLVEIAEYVRDLGVRRWDTTLFEPSGRATGKTGDFAPCTADVIASYIQLLDAVEEGRFETLEVRPILHYLRNVLSYSRRSMCLRNGCGAAADLVSVSVNGAIEACDCIKDPALRLGNMANRGIDAALDGAPADLIRSRSTESLLPCRTCDWRVFCGGTCLAKAGLNSIDEQQCRMSLALFPEIFTRLACSNRLYDYAQRFP